MNPDYKVIVEKEPRHWEAISVETFIKDYGIVPRCQNKEFILLQKDERGDLYKYAFPNPACIFMQGEIKYIIYKGGRTIINGVEIPPAEFISENSVFESEEEADKYIKDYNERNRGKVMYIDCPDGRRIYLNNE